MLLDAHNYKRRIELFFARLDKNEAICAEDKEILLKYRDYLVSEGITLGRVGKYLTDLRKASELLGIKFKDAKEEDIRKIITVYDGNENYSPWSKRDFKIAIRKFYTWLRGAKEYPPEVAWLKVYQRIRSQKTHDDILTEDEVKRLVECSPRVKDRAFIATLYESGCRIGEIVHMRIKQVKLDEYGAQLFVTGKTGFRRVRVVACVPFLTEWLNRHPLKDDPDAFLWPNCRFGPFSYNGISGILRRLAPKAGIKKKVNPHNFRHSRATHLANHLTEAQMKEHFGWAQDSKMAAIYVHLSGRDLDNALLKVYGMENKEEKKESVFKPRKCSRCDLVNQSTNQYCSKCGFPLNDEATIETVKTGMVRSEADKTLDGLLNDNEFREMFMRKIMQVQKKT
jgi:integrase